MKIRAVDNGRRAPVVTWSRVARSRGGEMRFTLCLSLLVSGLGIAGAEAQTVAIDAQQAGRPFPHFWEKAFGSGRAVLSLRDDYRRDLDQVKAITGFEYVRFHAIFDDENGVYDEDAAGKPVLNFDQVDLIYDGLLAHGIKPYVELSFMPRKLESKPAVFPFWYKPEVSPPKDDAKWAGLMEAFARHLIDRYGIDEVASWYFEVWNEPNLPFWAGTPPLETYLHLYDVTSRSLKKVSDRLRVGGPATAQAAWVVPFLEHAAKTGAPVDFVSTHVYANDTPQNVLGAEGPVNRLTMVPRAVDKVYRQVKSSSKPDLPIHWSEFNASYMNEVDVTDSPFMGPWLATTIANCDGKVALMSYWTFSDVFEEGGIFKNVFYGGFGLLANHSIPKAAFHAFRLLHRLGEVRIPVESDSVLATKRSDGTLEIALWSYADPGVSGPERTIALELKGAPGDQGTLERVDAEHGSPIAEWKRMGSPASPTMSQAAVLRAAAAAEPPERVRIEGGRITVKMPTPGLVLLEVPPRR